MGVFVCPNKSIAQSPTDFNYAEYSSYENFINDLNVTHRVINSGNWSDSDIWENSELPGDFAVIEIPNSFEVNFDLSASPKFKALIINGDLRSQVKRSQELNLSYLLVNGNFSVENAESSDTEFNLNLSDDDLLESFIALSPNGQIDLQGFEKEVSAYIGRNHFPNDQILYLDRLVDSWKRGDQVLVPSSEKSLKNKAEKLELSSMASYKAYYFRNISNSNHVSFFRKKHKNPKRSRLKVPILNISRNININNISNDNGNSAIFSAFGGSLNLTGLSLNNFGNKSIPAMNLHG